VIDVAHSGLPVFILDSGHTVALTTHVACKEAIKAVKTRGTRYAFLKPYHGGRVIGVMKAGVVRSGHHHVAFEAALAGTVRRIYRVKITVAGIWTETSTGVSRGGGKP
jgi:hypothetical protein